MLSKAFQQQAKSFVSKAVSRPSPQGSQ
jgi:processing peptidase subunit alpha